MGRLSWLILLVLIACSDDGSPFGPIARGTDAHGATDAESVTGSLGVRIASSTFPDPHSPGDAPRPFVTPNGDGVNDELPIGIELDVARGMLRVDVERGSGSRVRRLLEVEVGEGASSWVALWDGRNKNGNRVDKGTYLVGVVFTPAGGETLENWRNVDVRY